MYIEFTKEVVFRDCKDNILKTLYVGDRVEALGETHHYWITSMGGIYFDEAKEVEENS